MKAEFALDEIRKLIKKNEKNNRTKTIVIAGIAIVVGAIVLVLSKLKSKKGFAYDDWSELDDMDYDDYDDFDEFDDFDDFDDEYDYDYEDEDYDDESEKSEEK